MSQTQLRPPSVPLQVGDLVEVRSKSEIFATLDENGALENLPFMPEMLRYCGQRFTVFKRADKTCDTASGTGMRRLHRTVHLKELRCDGSAHDGCEAACLIFWKEAWLKKVSACDSAPEPAADSPRRGSPLRPGGPENCPCTEQTIHRATRRCDPLSLEIRYSCQATEVPKFSSPLPWWDLRQYARDLASGNFTLLQFARGLLLGAYNKFRQLCGRCDLYKLAGTKTRTPAGGLDLKPGDLVRIKPASQIRETLNSKGKNRGLTFTRDMVAFCGGQYRVLRRIYKIIDERNGKLINLSGGCLLLEGVVCNGELSRFCPRRAFQFWRDVWLAKSEAPALQTRPAQSTPAPDASLPAESTITEPPCRLKQCHRKIPETLPRAQMSFPANDRPGRPGQHIPPSPGSPRRQ